MIMKIDLDRLHSVTVLFHTATLMSATSTRSKLTMAVVMQRGIITILASKAEINYLLVDLLFRADTPLCHLYRADKDRVELTITLNLFPQVVCVSVKHWVASTLSS